MKLSQMDKTPSGRRPIRKVGILLVPDFALMSYASAVEPFRAANRLSGRDLYQWRHITTDGEPVRASNGVQIVPEDAVGDIVDFDLLIVCAGGNPAEFAHSPTLAWLRKVARSGTRIAGVSGGPLIVARAGLLEGYRCTIHWEHIPIFIEEFPRHDLRRSLFEIDRGRLSCSGGTAALDMMHALIEEDHGHELASDVVEWFLHTHVRSGDGPQRMPVRERLAVGDPKLVGVLETMDDNLEYPVSRQELAKIAAVSVRQLERLFKAHLDRSIADHYMELRLRRARVLLVQSTLSVLEVAMASGFISASHFSRAYKTRFGRSPRADRRPVPVPKSEALSLRRHGPSTSRLGKFVSP
jgi:transcriptional regulator GlxA family with amidase domain